MGAPGLRSINRIVINFDNSKINIMYSTLIKLLIEI
jgi:hypothetical protein